MKKLILKLTTLLLVLVGIASSCNPEPEKEYPIELSFTKYSLPETSCQWINLSYDEKVLIINSKAELEKYISCTEGTYPAIDFAKNTLLIASGKTTQNVDEITAKKIHQLLLNKYRLDIEIGYYRDNNTTANNKWNNILLIDKLADENEIELIVAIKEIKNKIIKPITEIDQSIIYFFDNTLYHDPSTCFFTTIDKLTDTCFLIRSISELQHACVCTDVLPEIDFDLYTLIIGKVRVGNPCYLVSELMIIENSILTLLVDVVRLDQTCPQIPTVKYHWGLYPKLSDKQFITKHMILAEN